MDDGADVIGNVIKKGLKRQTVFELIEPGSERILDIGYGYGVLLARLHREKGCRGLYGIERRPLAYMDGLLDGNWGNMFPEQPLDDAFLGYFNRIIMHDVVEHIPDPWSFLSHVRRYLAPDGRMIMVTPNMQHWDIVHALLNGDFPYGCGGLMNEEHIRWFTMKSLIETALLGGLKVERAAFLLGRGVTRANLDALARPGGMKVAEMPPQDQVAGTRINPFPTAAFLGGFGRVHARFEHDVKHMGYSFLATKLLLVCSANTENPDTPEVSYGMLPKLRQEFAARFGKRVTEFLPGGVELMRDL